MFSQVGKKTDLFLRFFTVAGERGVATKFYTEEGNWDLVGNNTPVFFLRDPLKSPDLNHAVERVWVKFHLKTKQGIKCLTDAQAEVIIGKDRERHQRDLYDSIEKGDFPRWDIKIQVMIEEQAAFHPANVIPGISFSPDKIFQGRLSAYGDAQRYRLGVNHHHIPVNAPRCPSHSYHRDGAMRTDGNQGGTPGHEPNSFGEWQEQTGLAETPVELSGDADHWNDREDDVDYYSQPWALFRLMSASQRKQLFGTTARAMGDAPEEAKVRHIAA